MTKKFFLIAGEASGDLLGSKLMRELKVQNPDADFIGVGGKLMQEQGLISIFPMEELSVMGFFEVVPHLFHLLARIKFTAQMIAKENPDFIITIDSPDFCFRVMKKVQNTSAKKIHLIAPSVWAYREGRAQKISKLYNLLLCILPFEPPFFEKQGLKTVFIGHPLMENAPDFSKKPEEYSAFRHKHRVEPSDLLIAVTPGSRLSEVKKIFPEFIEAINLASEKFPQIKVAIPVVKKTRELVLQMAKDLKVAYFFVEDDEKKALLFSADYAMAKSGTNTLEFSLYRIAMLVAYKINYLSYLLVKMMVKIKFANLINLILNEEVIPEMLQHKCCGKKIAEVLERLIIDKDFAQNQIKKSEVALKMMGLGSDENPSRKAAREIIK